MKLRHLIAPTIVSLLTAGAIALAQSPGVPSTFPVTWQLMWEASTLKPTYSATKNIGVAGSATNICQLRGSATRTVRLRRILLSGTAAAVQSELIGIQKYSTAFAGNGASTTAVPWDSQAAAASAAVESWTANPTAGTLVGSLIDPFFTWNNATTGVGAPLVLTFGERGSAAVLRGVAQSITVNMNANPGTSNFVSCTFEWTEETP